MGWYWLDSGGMKSLIKLSVWVLVHVKIKVIDNLLALNGLSTPGILNFLQAASSRDKCLHGYLAANNRNLEKCRTYQDSKAVAVYREDIIV